VDRHFEIVRVVEYEMAISVCCKKSRGACRILIVSIVHSNRKEGLHCNQVERNGRDEMGTSGGEQW
jgi:hypothetical protein